MDRITQSLVVFLLASCCDPEDMENELDRLDVELTDQLADTLLKDIDWDAQWISATPTWSSLLRLIADLARQEHLSLHQHELTDRLHQSAG